MDLVIAGALLLIAGILFYKFVERRHQVLFAKTLGAMCLLGGTVIAAALYFEGSEERLNTKRRAQVEVTFVDSRNHPAPGTSALSGRLEGVRDDTVPAVTFRICNRSKTTLNGLRFWPETMHDGRSTLYPVNLRVAATTYGYSDEELNSDYILKPGACSQIEWSGGPFRLLDTVIVQRKIATFVHD